MKKLVWTNRFTLEDCSRMTGETIEDCIKAFETIYKTPIPISLLIVGNRQARTKLLENVKNKVPTLLTGPNGTGKDTSLKEVAEKLSLEIVKSVPLKQRDVVFSFGKGPFYNNNNTLYIIDLGSFPKKKYGILLKYIKETERPLVFEVETKDKIHKKLLNELQHIHFTSPSPKDVEYFLKTKYNWNGKIEDIYDEDMRVVISRILASPELKSVQIKEPINSRVMAFNISCGYAKPEDFDNVKEPLWWIIRWLAYNQRKKFPNKTSQLNNLKMIAEIDRNKFYYPPQYIESMLIGLPTSPRRSQFSWPPWPKKEKIVKIELVEKISKKKSVKKEAAKVLEKVDFSKWL